MIDSDYFNLQGKRGLVIGIANKDSIAYGCARAFRALGADLAVTYLNEKARPFVEPAARAVGAELFLPCDVMVPGELEAVFAAIGERWGRLDFVLHSIAFAPRADLQGRLVDSSAEGFGLAVNISVHSFLRVAHLAEPLMPEGGSLFAMTFYGADKVMSTYNLMGPVKAALESAVRYTAAELGPQGIRAKVADARAGLGQSVTEHGEAYDCYARDLAAIAQIHGERAAQTAKGNYERNQEAWTTVAKALLTPRLAQQWSAYLTDAAQRAVLFTDAMRQRGNYFNEHEEGSDKTVLSWDHDLVIDGAKLARPVNYSLVRIRAPEGVAVRESGRPYIIIDPRAGHGSGIGGFKHDSEVGAAIHQGHPVYFVTFTRLPQPGQTIADVTAAEADFVREVRRRHPDAPRPIVIGNCQGGWAAMLLAATNPDITGPIVANGAPLSYWAGQKGKNPMRYMGGLVGGAMSIKFMSDLGNGLFDGSNLVSNGAPGDRLHLEGDRGPGPRALRNGHRGRHRRGVGPEVPRHLPGAHHPRTDRRLRRGRLRPSLRRRGPLLGARNRVVRPDAQSRGAGHEQPGQRGPARRDQPDARAARDAERPQPADAAGGGPGRAGARAAPGGARGQPLPPTRAVRR